MFTIGTSEIKSGDLGKYTAEYLQKITSISDHINKFDGIKTHIQLNYNMDTDDILRASLLLSDLTTLSIEGDGEAKILMDRKPREITFPVEMVKEFNIQPNESELGFGLFQSIDPKVTKFCQQILPFIESGSLIIKPKPLVMFKKADHHWHSLPLIPLDKDNNWVVASSNELDGELPMRIETFSKIPFDIALPYLKGINWHDYRKILLDSTDTLVNLRRALKNAIKELEHIDSDKMIEIRRDIIDPEIESLRRQYNKIMTVQHIKAIGTTIGTMALSLSACFANDSIAAVSGLLGAGGLGLLSKDYADYKEKILSLKENPYYLFWRANHKNGI